jgi:uncharacterized protein YegP (UPF0339 family)
MSGKYVLKKDNMGEFRFNLVAKNGEVIASSEGYGSKAAALKGIDSIRRNAVEAELVDDTQ